MAECEMHRFRVCLVVTVAITLCNAQIVHSAGTISASRTCIEGWHNAGYPGEIPAPDKIVNVMDYGAVADGATDDYTAIINARNALGGAGVIYFPAGTYKCDSTISLNQDGQVIRGQRATSTKLLFEVPAAGEGSPSIRIQGGGAGAWQSMNSGYTFGSKSIDVDTGSSFIVGEYGQTRQTNEPSWNLPPGWQDYACGQMVHIMAITNNTLYLETPLRYTYNSSLGPAIRPINAMRKDCGVENISVQQVSNGTVIARNNVSTMYFYLAARGWVRGVIGLDGFGGHATAQHSTQIEVTGCFFNDAIEHDGGGSGYGVRLEFKSGEVLVENNIFTTLRHSVLIQIGANGNVLGYNYSRDPYRTETSGPFLTGDLVSHGTYPYANLFEGNLVNFISVDNSHDANGPWNTFFRNRAIYHGIAFTDTLITNANIVGNEFRSDGWPGGGYVLDGGGHYTYGNATENDGNPEPAGFTTLPDYSYYLTNDPAVAPPLPDWWTAGSDVRVFGPKVGGDFPIDIFSTNAIPAKLRYDAGGIMTVGTPSIAKQPTNAVVVEGGSVSFTVEAYGNAGTGYKWYKGTNTVGGGTASNLVINPAALGDAGSYYCVISDNEGSVKCATSTLTVQPAASSFDIDVSWSPPSAGSVTPSGTVSVASGGTTSFVVQAASYYEISSIQTNGIDVSGVPATNDWTLVWANVSATGSVYAVFVSRETTNGTPYTWLVANGLLTNDSPVAAAAAAGGDSDSDGSSNGDEYHAGTDPTNGVSVLKIDSLAATNLANGLLVWQSVTGRRYDIATSTDLRGSFSLIQTNILGSAPTDSTSVPMTNNPVFYRIQLTP